MNMHISILMSTVMYTVTSTDMKKIIITAMIILMITQKDVQAAAAAAAVILMIMHTMLIHIHMKLLQVIK